MKTSSFKLHSPKSSGSKIFRTRINLRDRDWDGYSPIRRLDKISPVERKPDNGRAKPWRIRYPFVLHPHAPGLSHSCGFASPIQQTPVFHLCRFPFRSRICSIDATQSCLDCEFGFSEFNHFMMGHSSNPAHGDAKRIKRNYPICRGSRPTTMGIAGMSASENLS
ncbi:MAG: hypothetical protein QOH31_2966 [Verrucomicrobiota bacterium]